MTVPTLPEPTKTVVFVVAYGPLELTEYTLLADGSLLAFQTAGLANGFRFQLERGGVDRPRVLTRTLRELADYVDAIGGPSRFVLFETLASSEADAGERMIALGAKTAERLR